jgi:signal transduction histidine kinase
MQELLDDLLELSRVGRVQNASRSVSLTQLAQEAVELLQGAIRLRGVKIEIAEGMPVVYGDEPRLREVLQNLVENAVKFMGSQPQPMIQIGARVDNEVCIAYVKDNGIGIDARYHQKIFGLFEQLSPDVEGTGIGLALVKRIIEIHGGKVWVESEGIGHGTTFYFTLPLSEFKEG